ncbi:ribosomal L33 protein [Rutstroemia sp. NJR-2017a BBW]|nr:ribosomal L33 protein [Rutstroemia sp. NJR-2017a BBW]
MALTGYYKTLVRPRAHRPLSMLKYDPVGESSLVYFIFRWLAGGLECFGQ